MKKLSIKQDEGCFSQHDSKAATMKLPHSVSSHEKEKQGVAGVKKERGETGGPYS